MSGVAASDAVRIFLFRKFSSFSKSCEVKTKVYRGFHCRAHGMQYLGSQLGLFNHLDNTCKYGKSEI